MGVSSCLNRSLRKTVSRLKAFTSSQAFRFYIEKIIIPIHFETSFRSCIPGSLIKLYLFSWKFYLKRTTALIMSVAASEGNKLIRLNPSRIMDVLAGSLVGKLPRFTNVIIVLG